MNPTTTASADADRFDVRSADGTSLAVWVDGEGPALVLVHGSMQDHTASATFVGELRRHVATFSMDRRGCGASGDAEHYSLEREFEDVAAVATAVSERTGHSVALWGHSYGANCAMGGAALADSVGHLVLYEPSLGLAYPPGAIEMVEEALAAGDRDTAIVSALVTMVGLDHDQIETLRAQPTWPSRVATAPTIPRECRTEQEWVYRPGQFDAIAAPTLVLAGSESGATVKLATDRAVAAIPGARVRVLAGHGHLAHRTDPATVAAIVTDFVSS